MFVYSTAKLFLGMFYYVPEIQDLQDRQSSHQPRSSHYTLAFHMVQQIPSHLSLL